MWPLRKLKAWIGKKSPETPKQPTDKQRDAIMDLLRESPKKREGKPMSAEKPDDTPCTPDETRKILEDAKALIDDIGAVLEATKPADMFPKRPLTDYSPLTEIPNDDLGEPCDGPGDQNDSEPGGEPGDGGACDGGACDGRPCYESCAEVKEECSEPKPHPFPSPENPPPGYARPGEPGYEDQQDMLKKMGAKPNEYGFLVVPNQRFDIYASANPSVQHKHINYNVVRDTRRGLDLNNRSSVCESSLMSQEELDEKIKQGSIFNDDNSLNAVPDECKGDPVLLSVYNRVLRDMPHSTRQKLFAFGSMNAVRQGCLRLAKEELGYDRWYNRLKRWWKKIFSKG